MNAQDLTVHLEHRVDPRRASRPRGMQLPSQGLGCAEQSPTSTIEPTAWFDQEFTD